MWEKSVKGMDIEGDSQGCTRGERNGKEESETGAGSGQMTAPEETRSDISAYDFWKRITSSVFDI